MRGSSTTRAEHGLDDRERARVEIDRATGLELAVDRGELATHARDRRQHARGKQRAPAEPGRGAHIFDERRRDADRRAVIAGAPRMAAFELGALAAEHEP